MRRFMWIALITILGAPFAAYGASPAPAIVASSVETTASADIIRLVVAPTLAVVEHKIVCGDGMIRVRLNGVSNNGKELQDLLLPQETLFYSVRIVERNKEASVVQLIPRRRFQTHCALTSVVSLGGEIIISTARDAGDNATRDAASQLKTAEAVVPNGKKGTAEAARAGDPESKSGIVAPLAARTPSQPLHLKDAKTAAKKPLVTKAAGVEMDSTRLVLIFGFAALVAGVALYLRRRKKSPIDALEQIEILSTRRLGLKQQLMLVSVQGTKFLLAVGDKSVSSLGTVPEEGAIVPAGSNGFRLDDTLNAKENIGPAIESLLKEAARQTAKPPLRRMPAESTRFDRELSQALGAAEYQSVRDDSLSSNAAGLVALARMRANMRKGAEGTPTFEA